MKNIFLIGMPSSGKTTLGKQLARHTHYRFLDTDKLIEKEQGMTISQLFAQKGEAYFRECEAHILRAIRANSKLIIATGGGMPCFHDNIDYIKANGISVFLDVKPDEIWKRMQHHTTNDRPLYDKNNEELLRTLQQKYNDRLPYYSQADFRISGSTNVHQLLEMLQEVLG